MESATAPTSLGSLNALLPGPMATFPSAKGTVYLWENAPHMFVTCVSGKLTAEGAQAIETGARRAVSRYGAHPAFHDWEAMTDYESEARARLTQVGLDLFKYSQGIHVLARSTIVRLGVQAVSLVLRKIRMHADRVSFEKEIRQQLQSKKP